MKTFYVATLALSMLAAPAIAAPRDNHAGAQAQHQGQNKGQNKAQSQNKAQHKAAPQHQGKRHVQTQKRAPSHAQANAARQHNARPQAHRQYSYNGRHYNAVRAPAWHAPRGHDARRVWNRGDRMSSAYRVRSNVIDYRAYHLARPAYGYQWVRAGNNVYLVRAANGLVAQIVWNMFY